ncbi:glycosyltransferase family 2 protein [Commensalibacter nepenthis]|uniref:Glycosyltransferase family 2 protein n=1 Tax=Commensalibacter nepenthis TaxID=3043872 RepID=A0ABT6Q5F7_9PROT|nr:glycosyltransferase family 2 protein [Commensalibacter sp. TBRC 10068]MDI2112138.1 glycosyltransferase family 2 protein [Commensalibacter sp. TBRC 10068]
MPNIRCITMQKNETYLLDAWIKYYTYLFGIENLYILDNGSTNEKTKEILSSYEVLGCHVIRQYDTGKDFEDKGDIIGNIIKEWDKKEAYDFAIPIDIDEFIILQQEYPSCNKDEIHHYFQSLVGIQDAFLMHESYLNVPGEVGFFSPTCVAKGFFARNTIQYLDHGFHHPAARNSKKKFDTRLAYVHFHNRSFEETLALAKAKLTPYVNVNNLESVKNYVGPGGHLVQYFSMSKYEYFQLYRNHGNIYFYQLIQLFLSLSIDIDSVFNAKYIPIQPSDLHKILIRYPDVNKPENYSIGYVDIIQYLLTSKDVKDAGIHPIRHICLHGFIDETRMTNVLHSTLSVPRDNFTQYLSNPNDLYIFNLKLSQLK